MHKVGKLRFFYQGFKRKNIEFLSKMWLNSNETLYNLSEFIIGR